jgi:hypothetical protein
MQMKYSIIILLSLVLIVGVSAPASAQTITDDILITLSSDKSIYNFDDTALIQGTVSERVFVEKPFFQTLPILINISGPNYEQVVSLYPDSNLNYETTLKLVQVLGIVEGNYIVSVNYAGVTTNTSFSVESKIIEETQDRDSLLTVMTENSDYFPGQLITMTGTTSKIIPFESIQFTITDSIGDLVTSGNLFTSDGQFQTSIFLTTVNPSYGVYTIDVEYGDHIESVTFNVIEVSTDESKSVILVSDSMSFNLDKFEYLLNDSMTLSGSITNFDSVSDIYYQVVYFNFLDSNGNSPMFRGMTEDTSAVTGDDVEFKLTAIPDDSGNFSVTARMPHVIFSEDNYVVKANYGGFIVNQSFSIVSEVDSNVQTNSTNNDNSSISEKSSDVFNVRTIIEKMNRISDTLVSINTEEKIIENKPVKPRVLSGSMITMSKNNLSDVNLQVMSESGICIIGPGVDCLVSESTRKPGQIFDVVQVDGLNLNVRYSGPDVRLEKFSILPTSSDEFLPNANWNVEVIKTDEISRLYYKITYKTLE